MIQYVLPNFRAGHCGSTLVSLARVQRVTPYRHFADRALYHLLIDEDRHDPDRKGARARGDLPAVRDVCALFRRLGATFGPYDHFEVPLSPSRKVASCVFFFKNAANFQIRRDGALIWGRIRKKTGLRKV